MIFVVALAIFRLSPLHPINDSKYTMMLSQCLLEHRSFQLDHYAIPRLPPIKGEDYIHNGDIYQIEQVGPHLYYVLPPGTSVLSLPFVSVANALGVSAVNPDGTLNLKGETTIEAWLAAILMAALASIFFYTAELLLPLPLALLLTTGASLGTQIWSTTSRAMFTDTWAVLLLALVIFRLLSHASRGSKLRPVLIASLLAWAYLVYPTYATHVVTITAYLLLVFNARQLLAYFLTGICWASGLVIYSWHNFGHILPSYFRPGRLFYRSFHNALVGNMISPSRGLLIYVPAIFFVVYLLIRFRKYLSHRKLVGAALVAIFFHWIAISGIGHWWGGHGYGPRYTTGMIPWFFLLAILGMKAMLAGNKTKPAVSVLRRRAVAFSGIVLAAASVWINGRGAISLATSEWNSRPMNIDTHPERIWDWRQPQFLAGLLPPPAPDFPLIEPGTRIDFTQDASEKYLWYGWSNAETDFRWTDSSSAAIVFALSENKPAALQIAMAPFLAPGKLDEQTVIVNLNGEIIATLSLITSETQVYSINLPLNVLRQKNVLKFEMPNAAAPVSFNLNEDRRPLGIRVAYAQFSNE